MKKWQQQHPLPRPRWVFIAHTKKLAVGSKFLSKSGNPDQPPTEVRIIRPSSNGHKTSRWNTNRNVRQPKPGPSDDPGCSAQGRGSSAPRVSRNPEMQWYWFSSTANNRSEQPHCGSSVSQIGTSDSQRFSELKNKPTVFPQPPTTHRNYRTAVHPIS